MGNSLFDKVKAEVSGAASAGRVAQNKTPDNFLSSQGANNAPMQKNDAQSVIDSNRQTQSGFSPSPKKQSFGETFLQTLNADKNAFADSWNSPSETAARNSRRNYESNVYGVNPDDINRVRKDVDYYTSGFSDPSALANMPAGKAAKINPIKATDPSTGQSVELYPQLNGDWISGQSGDYYTFSDLYNLSEEDWNNLQWLPRASSGWTTDENGYLVAPQAPAQNTFSAVGNTAANTGAFMADPNAQYGFGYADPNDPNSLYYYNDYDASTQAWALQNRDLLNNAGLDRYWYTDDGGKERFNFAAMMNGTSDADRAAQLQAYIDLSRNGMHWYDDILQNFGEGEWWANGVQDLMNSGMYDNIWDYWMNTYLPSRSVANWANYGQYGRDYIDPALRAGMLSTDANTFNDLIRYLDESDIAIGLANEMDPAVIGSFNGTSLYDYGENGPYSFYNDMLSQQYSPGVQRIAQAQGIELPELQSLYDPETGLWTPAGKDMSNFWTYELADDIYTGDIFNGYNTAEPYFTAEELNTIGTQRGKNPKYSGNAPTDRGSITATRSPQIMDTAITGAPASYEKLHSGNGGKMRLDDAWYLYNMSPEDLNMALALAAMDNGTFG